MPNSHPNAVAVNPNTSRAVQRQKSVERAVQHELRCLCSTRDQDEPIAPNLGDAPLEVLPWLVMRTHLRGAAPACEDDGDGDTNELRRRRTPDRTDRLRSGSQPAQAPALALRPAPWSRC